MGDAELMEYQERERDLQPGKEMYRGVYTPNKACMHKCKFEL